MKKTTLAPTALLALALGVSAAASAATFNYNYVEGGFGELEHDGDALFVNGAKDVDKNWGVAGGLYLGDFDGGDTTALEGGVLFHQPLKSNLNLNFGAKLLYVNVDPDCNGFGCDGDSDIGLVGNVGLRFQVQPQLQLEGDAKLIVIDDEVADDGLGVQAAARYYFDPRLSVAGGLAVDTELDGLFVSLRYDL